jgi:exopolyphosphatase/guanosine-5'-triphosphate,3'-diphosphate pyrophosphatase
MTQPGQPAARRRAPMRVAAIDCGTNAIRLLIAELHTDAGAPRLVDVHRELRIIRLGEGVDATGTITTQAIDRAWSALSDYTAVIRASGVLAGRMVATSAARDAANADEFADMVRSTLGWEPEVLTGVQEAELGFLGAVSHLDPRGGDVLLVDIGGGSTELVAGRPSGDGVQITGSVSVDIGSVRITERILTADPPGPDQRAAAQAWSSQVINDGLDRIDISRVRRVVAVAGTALTVAAAVLGHTLLDPKALEGADVPIAGIDRATTFLLRAPRAQRAMLRYLHPGRVDVIGGGAMILRTVADELARRIGVQAIAVSEHDILDGLALSLAPLVG